MRFRSSGLLTLVLVSEVILFAPNFGNFYCGDSLFFFRTMIRSWKQFLNVFSSIDGLTQYRPFTFVFFTYVVHPLAGMSLFRQHLFPIFFHGINTILVYCISRKVTDDRRNAILSAFFFGVSATGAYITYDNTFLPDYLYAVLYLTALLLLSLKLESGKAVYGILSFVFFLGSLFSKEAGVTFPAAALVYLLLVRKKQANKLSRFELRRIGMVLIPSACACLAYLAWHLWKKNGSLYPSNPADAHSLHASFATLQSKVPLVLQALGLPRISAAGWLESFAYILMCLFLASVLLCTIVGCLRRNGIYISGLVWGVINIAPALLLLSGNWEHNMYLPLVGISWIFSQAINDLADKVQFIGARFRFAALGMPVLILYLWGVSENALFARTSSWMAGGSRIAKDCLADLNRMYPYIPHDTLIYIETSGRKEVVWYFDSGSLAATFYRDPTIKMRFSDDGLPPPGPELVLSRKVIVLRYMDGRLFDMSARRRLEAIDKNSYRIRDHWKQGSVLMPGKEFTLKKQPTQFVFPYEFSLNGSGRDTLVLVAGSGYVHPLPSIPRGSRLRIGVTTSMLHATGLDAELRIIEPGGRERMLYSRRFPPEIADRRWDDRDLPLDGIEGSGYQLKLSAVPIPGTGNAGNWLEWGPLEVVPPESQGLEKIAELPPPQPRALLFEPSTTYAGDMVTIKAVGGTNMEIDCQYKMNSSEPKTMNNCWVMDANGTMRAKVDIRGHYVFTAIRNSRRQDWVPIHSEWNCR